MSEPVAVSILDREYLIACSAEERAGLIAAAAHLDGKLRDLRNANRGGGLDRIAVLAALNLAHELLNLRQQEAASSTHLAQHLQAIKSKLDAALPTSLQ
jgi:cell division protein ZapA